MKQEKNEEKTIFCLDDNNKLQVELSLQETGDQVTVTAELNLNNLDYDPNPEFIKNITNLLSLQYGEDKKNDTHIKFMKKKPNIYKAILTFNTEDLKPEKKLNININNVDIGRYHLSHDGIAETETDAKENKYSRLTVSETRMLSRKMTPEQLARLPYHKIDFSHRIDGDCMPVMDIHTHLSAQLTGEDWKHIIQTHEGPIYYPLDMLKLIYEKIYPGEDGLAVLKSDLHSGKSITREVGFHPAVNLNYPPLASELPVKRDKKTGESLDKYDCIDLHELADSSDPKMQDFFKRFIWELTIPIDRIIGPDEMDTGFFRYRNPLEKNAVLQEDKILTIARKYAEQNIRYAEMSSTEVLSPVWLKAASEAIEKAEQKYPVKIRLLAAIHRTKSPSDIARDLEKTKIAANNPYVVGLDFMGYESNKGESLNWALFEMARWARRMQAKRKGGRETAPYTDDFIIRLHAGETSKQSENVSHAIEIAEKFDIPIRIGHLVRGSINEELIEKAIRNKVFLEFIPDSNIALNNADFAEDIPIKAWADTGVHYGIYSDGAGAYQTTPMQLAKMGLFAGLTIEDLRQMQKNESAYITERLTHFDKKKAAYHAKNETHADFQKYCDQEIALMSENGLPRRYEEKVPHLFAGASGDNWKQITDADQLEVAIMSRMSVRVFHPKKIFYHSGRAKKYSMEKELDKAVAVHDQKNYKEMRGFDMVATYAGGHDDLFIADGVNWVNKAPGDVENVPPKVMEFMSRYGDNGYSLFAGGGAFTREFIRLANKLHLPFGLMMVESRNNRYQSATDEMARHIDQSHIIRPTKDMPLAVATILHMVKHTGKERLQEEYQLSPDALKENIKVLYNVVKREVLKERNEEFREQVQLTQDRYERAWSAPAHHGTIGKTPNIPHTVILP